MSQRAAGSNNALTNNLFDGTYLGEVAWLKYWERLRFYGYASHPPSGSDSCRRNRKQRNHGDTDVTEPNLSGHQIYYDRWE